MHIQLTISEVYNKCDKQQRSRHMQKQKKNCRSRRNQLFSSIVNAPTDPDRSYIKILEYNGNNTTYFVSDEARIPLMNLILKNGTKALFKI